MVVAPVLDTPWFRRVVTEGVEVLRLPRRDTGVRLHANDEGLLQEQPEWDTVVLYFDYQLVTEMWRDQDPDTKASTKRVFTSGYHKVCGVDHTREESDPEVLRHIRQVVAIADEEESRMQV